MADRPWHKRYHGNAIAGYMGLTLEERGAYSTLLDYLYDRRAPLPGNMRLLAGYLDVSVRKAEAVIESLIRKGKLYRRDDDTISNRRFEKEVENDARTADHMAEIGSIGGRKSAETKKTPSENNGGRQRTLKPRSSYPEPETRDQKEGRSAAGAKAPSLPGLEFPEWWPKAEWDGFVAMRKKIRAPLTERAIELIVGEVTEFRAAGDSPGAVLDQSTKKGWRGVFRLKPDAPAGLFGANPAPVDADTALWTWRLVAFHHGDREQEVAKGYWATKWGPEPGQPGCRVPQEAITAYAAQNRPRATGTGQ